MSKLKAEFDRNLVKLTDSYYPIMTPLRVQVYRSQQLQRWLNLEIEWKMRLAQQMRTLGKAFDLVAEVRRLRMEFMAPLEEQFQEAVHALEALRPEDLRTLQQYDNPPDTYRKVVEFVLVVREEPPTDWEEAKVMFTESYFSTFFVKHAKAYNMDRITDEMLERLEPFIQDLAVDPSEIERYSPPCGALSTWIRALYNHGRAHRILQCPPCSAPDLDENVETLTGRLRLAQAEVLVAEGELGDLQEQCQQRVQALRVRYDGALEPLQETFFEAHHRFNTIASGPPRARHAIP
eukprot:GGOE01013937.1.p1 GENE.GGOE01013937.1~~GGOE01013937.1.p1  ORF type:complete len:328 (+),score=72.46 GGOE01013937.1:109-984(+)